MGTQWMPEPEVDARPLRPRAHWVAMPDGQGRSRLTMVWAVPDPIPAVSEAAARAATRA